MSTASRPGVLVNGLAAAVFLQWVGAGAVLPTLPVFLEQRGAGPTLVGVAMSAFFVAGVVFQYPVGRLVDRIGERPVLVAGLLLYALASLAFLLPVTPWACVAARFAQGVGSGAVTVAALSAVGHHVAPEQRGSGFARVYAGDIAGLAVGPMIGAIAGTDHLGVLFGIAAIASTLAAGAVAFVVPKRQAVPHEGPSGSLFANRRTLVTGLLLVAGIGGLTAGVYETCWTLLLDQRGATTFAIGLSWTLYCIPFVVTTPFVGALLRRFDRRRLATFSLTATAVLVGVYPFVGSLAVIIALGVLEAAGTAIAFPAAQALLADGVPVSLLGRTQGLFAATQTAATAVAAAAGGALFGVGPAVPFVTTSVASIVLLVTLTTVWRRRDDAASASGSASPASGPTPQEPLPHQAFPSS